MLLDAFGDDDFSDEDWEHALGGWHVVVTLDGGPVLTHAAVVPRVLDVADHAFRTGYVEGVATATPIGPSHNVALTAPISCEARAGDDW